MTLTTRNLTAALASAAVCFGTEAATIIVSQTAPTDDGINGDIDNFISVPANNELAFKYFSDVERNAGQTFTPSQDTYLRSFTVQIWRNSQNPVDGANENVNVRLGTIDRSGGWSFNQFYAEDAPLVDDWNSSDYITFELDEDQKLEAGVEYGIILYAEGFGNWRNGIPYLEAIHRDGSYYTGGDLIGRGNPNNTRDLKFFANMVPSPSAAIFGLAGLGALVARRRRQG